MGTAAIGPEKIRKLSILSRSRHQREEIKNSRQNLQRTIPSTYNNTGANNYGGSGMDTNARHY